MVKQAKPAEEKKPSDFQFDESSLRVSKEELAAQIPTGSAQSRIAAFKMLQADAQDKDTLGFSRTLPRSYSAQPPTNRRLGQPQPPALPSTSPPLLSPGLKPASKSFVPTASSSEKPVHSPAGGARLSSETAASSAALRSSSASPHAVYGQQQSATLSSRPSSNGSLKKMWEEKTAVDVNENESTPMGRSYAYKPPSGPCGENSNRFEKIR